ncbi:MAG: sigma-70 family RNA polymerase sigma factor [Erythrobacter sp.]|jgi:RNA polymerase sigma-70 factor (ECF subfamily)|nr:sigma-70 family RNA polymerase sigma factor [Erythrobacter sp.]
MNGTWASQHGQSSGGAPAASDAALVQRIAARDEAAFRSVIAAHAPMLHRIAWRMVGEAQEAEDIVQEAMLRLWDQAPRLAGGGSGVVRLGAWLGRVTVNLAIDRLRIARRISGEQVPERADEAPLMDRRIEAAQETSAARALIAALPERQRAAIVLTYFEELPNAEAAQAMDMNIKAFESLLHRARSALRTAFEAREGETP